MAVANRPRSFSVIDLLLRPVATFTYNYFFRLGFLDGREGLLLHLYHAVYVSEIRQRRGNSRIAKRRLHPRVDRPIQVAPARAVTLPGWPAVPHIIKGLEGGVGMAHKEVFQTGSC